MVSNQGIMRVPPSLIVAGRKYILIILLNNIIRKIFKTKTMIYRLN
jgi:hypothetical protein